jgi:hypothetical protein
VRGEERCEHAREREREREREIGSEEERDAYIQLHALLPPGATCFGSPQGEEGGRESGSEH